jgi:hypothetical protein
MANNKHVKQLKQSALNAIVGIMEGGASPSPYCMEMVTLAEAAIICGRTTQTIKLLCWRQALRFRQSLGGVYLVYLTDLLEHYQIEIIPDVS